MSSSFIQMLKSMSDEEIVIMAKSEGFDLTLREVQKLRPYIHQISFSWLFFGIPNDVAQALENILGRKRSRQLMALFTK